MSKIEVNMEGLNDLLHNVDVLRDKTITAQATGMAQVCIDVANEAKENHTFQNRTGNLEASIQPLPVEIEGDSVVGIVQASSKDKAGMEYAPFVEFGTSKSAAYPFMQPAAEANKGNFLTTIAAVTEHAQQTLKVLK